MSDPVRPHRRQPTRLPRPWDSPGKNTGLGCHFLLQCMKVKSESEVAQSCPTLSDPMDCSLPGSSAHGIFQARVLEWGAIAFSSAIKKNEIMSFAATWMNLEILILTEISQRQISHDILICGIFFLKKVTNELIYKTETDSQTLKTDLWLLKGKRGREG